MEQVALQISSVQNDLHASRSKLRVIEKNSKTAIPAKVEEARSFVRSIDRRIESVCKETNKLLAQIEYATENDKKVFAHPENTVIAEMTARLAWLRSSLEAIATDFDKAQTATIVAITTTNGFTLAIMDIGHNIDDSSAKLAECQQKAKMHSDRAIADLEASKAALKQAQSDLSGKQFSITSKQSTAANHRAKKAQLESNLQQKRWAIEAAEQEKKTSKQQAGVSFGVGLLGLVAAPFTLGISLAVSVPLFVVAGIKADSASDLSKEVSSLRNEVVTTDSALSTTNREITSLETECRQLTILVSCRYTEIAQHEREQPKYRRQIAAASSASSEISTLKSYAASTRLSVAQALPSLAKAKDALEELSISIKERALEVESGAQPLTMRERISDLTPGGGGPKAKRLRREVGRQTAAIKRVTEALESVRGGLPALLENSGTDKGRFIDVQPWSAGTRSERMVIGRRRSMRRGAIRID